MLRSGVSGWRVGAFLSFLNGQEVPAALVASLWAARPPLPATLHSEGHRHAAPLRGPSPQLLSHCSSQRPQQ